MEFNKYRVKDFMQTDIKTIEKDASLSDAAKKMRETGVSSLIVNPEGDWDACGIITRKDIVESLVEEMLDIKMLFVEDVMTKPALTVNADLSIDNCLKIMRMIGVRRLPVTDGSALAGIISNSDIFTKLIKDIP